MGKITYEVMGFHRDSSPNGEYVYMLVDAEQRDLAAGGPFNIARQIAGEEYCFHSSSTVSETIPDDVKNILFQSEQEYYERVPQMVPPWKRKKQRRRAR